MPSVSPSTRVLRSWQESRRRVDHDVYISRYRRRSSRPPHASLSRFRHRVRVFAVGRTYGASNQRSATISDESSRPNDHNYQRSATQLSVALSVHPSLFRESSVIIERVSSGNRFLEELGFAERASERHRRAFRDTCGVRMRFVSREN